jgi:hypothetical protein
MFWGSEHHIVKRTCAGCDSTHQEIFYKRLTDVDSFDVAHVLYDTWSDTNNVLGTDFSLFSTVEDAWAGTNPWTFCSYNDNGIGFPRDCGPTSHSVGQWNSLTRGGQTVQFLILASCGRWQEAKGNIFSDIFSSLLCSGNKAPLILHRHNSLNTSFQRRSLNHPLKRHHAMSFPLPRLWHWPSLLSFARHHSVFYFPLFLPSFSMENIAFTSRFGKTQ